MSPSTRAGRWIKRHWIVPFVVLSSSLAIIGAAVWADGEAAKRDRVNRDAAAARVALIESNQTLIGQNDRVIDCTTPGRGCFEESQKRTAQTLAVAFAEMDCRTRRALAGMAAPDPSKGTCASQTPQSVYPGGP